MKQPPSIPVLAALLFAAFAALAAASLYPVMTRFAAEAGIDEWVFIAVRGREAARRQARIDAAGVGAVPFVPAATRQ